MNKENQLKELYDHSTVSINGDLIGAADAKVSIFDRGFLYGDSIYEVAYSKNGSLIFFDDHLDRLYKSASLLNLHIFYSKAEIITEAIKVLKESKLKDAYLRIIITRGETEITLDPSGSFKNNLVIIAKPKPIHNIKFYTKGIDLAIVSILRNDTRSTNPSAKSGNYLNNVLAVNEAKKLQFDDALMVNQKGCITEGSSFNIWMVKDGIIYTPPANSGLLQGITREKLLNILDNNQIIYKTEDFYPEDIITADEVFITSSTREVMPVGKINQTKFDVQSYSITNKLQALFKEALEIEKKKMNYNYI